MTKPIVGEGGVTSQGWHSIESYLRCPKAYKLSQFDKLHKPLAYLPGPFAVGLLLHAGRAQWFGCGFDCDWTAVQAAMAAEAERSKLPMQLKDVQEAERLM